MQGAAISETQRPELEALIQALAMQRGGPGTLIVKRGKAGATIFDEEKEPIDVPGFPVEILNTVGAGDAFAGGLLYGFTQGWDWRQAVRMGNACGALVVTRHGCGTAMPSHQEAMSFIAEQDRC